MAPSQSGDQFAFVHFLCNNDQMLMCLIYEDGIEMDSNSFNGVQDAWEQDTAARFCQFFHCMACMTSSIPLFAQRATLRYDILEEFHQSTGRRTEKAIAKYRVTNPGWSGHHSEAFKERPEQLLQAVNNAHRNREKQMCLHKHFIFAFLVVEVTHRIPGDLEKPA